MRNARNTCWRKSKISLKIFDVLVVTQRTLAIEKLTSNLVSVLENFLKRRCALAKTS